MNICIDSNAFVLGLRGIDPAAMRVLELVGSELNLVIPRLVAQEVTRNLSTSDQVKQFYRLFQNYSFAQIIDEPVPPTLVAKYISLGLPAKADAFIGAFAEWINVSYLISENRHFLRELKTSTFQVLDASEFVKFWESSNRSKIELE
jgi:predicted nucleic acid-binding protein